MKKNKDSYRGQHLVLQIELRGSCGGARQDGQVTALSDQCRPRKIRGRANLITLLLLILLLWLLVILLLNRRGPTEIHLAVQPGLLPHHIHAHMLLTTLLLLQLLNLVHSGHGRRPLEALLELVIGHRVVDVLLDQRLRLLLLGGLGLVIQSDGGSNLLLWERRGRDLRGLGEGRVGRRRDWWVHGGGL